MPCCSSVVFILSVDFYLKIRNPRSLKFSILLCVYHEEALVERVIAGLTRNL